MKTVKLKKDQRIDVIADRSLGVQTYGKGNDYPQSVMELLQASVTGLSCFETYKKFVYGKGFKDEVLYDLVINRKGQTADQLLGFISEDFSEFGGFCLHFNYDLNYKVSEIQHVPFEMARYQELNDKGQFSKIKIHHDWGKRDTANRKFNKEDIKEYPIFNPAKVASEILAAGGAENYKGQIYYFSNRGFGVYPLPIFDPALTDMSTEEGLSNVCYRNVRQNFFPAGMFVEITAKDQNEDAEIETANQLKGIQGDENAGKILYLQVDSKEEIPTFIPFDAKNLDKELTVTSDSVKDRIGRCFSQPPILRGEDIGGNFGADLMINAYNYYNTFTSNERFILEQQLAYVLSYWNTPLNVSTEIIPLTFGGKFNPNDIPVELLSVMSVNEKRDLLGLEEVADVKADQTILAEKIGVGGVQAMVQIAIDPLLSSEQKKGMLKLLFNLSEEQANALIPTI